MPDVAETAQINAPSGASAMPAESHGVRWDWWFLFMPRNVGSRQGGGESRKSFSTETKRAAALGATALSYFG